MKMTDIFTKDQLALYDYLEEHALMVCTHDHGGRYYLEEDDFYERSSTVYASREVPFHQVKGLKLVDGKLTFPGVEIELD